MSETQPSIEFFKGVAEELTNVRLRQGKETGVRNVLMFFRQMKALDILNSYTKQATGTLRLVDSEGEIDVTPSSVKIRYGGDEGDDLMGVECQIDIDRDDHWERLMRFLNRYAEANGMAYQGKDEG
ncbi:MAG: photosystem II reaction center protein Psb28 [Cyanobacteria bacterium P01_E01_bin.42]